MPPLFQLVIWATRHNSNSLNFKPRLYLPIDGEKNTVGTSVCIAQGSRGDMSKIVLASEYKLRCFRCHDSLAETKSYTNRSGRGIGHDYSCTDVCPVNQNFGRGHSQLRTLISRVLPSRARLYPNIKLLLVEVRENRNSDFLCNVRVSAYNYRDPLRMEGSAVPIALWL